MSSRLELIEKTIAAGSEDAFHWYARAMELRSLGRAEDALGAYADVRAKFPGYIPTYLMAAQVSQELERDDEAREWTTQGIARADKIGDAHAKSELSAFLDQLE